MKHRLHRLMALLFLGLPGCCAKPPAAPLRTNQKVVLVHGIFESGALFKTLQKRLEKRGVEVLVPRLKHADGRGGLDLLAVHLKRDIEQKFGPTAPVSIVGFSMGGLVSRQYLQNHGGAARCESLVTISSPHHGTRAAWCYPSQGVVDMRPGSPFLTALHQTQGKLGDMPVTSYRTPWDLVILPPTSSVWDRAENLAYPVILHPLMLSSDRVLTDIERRLVKDLDDS